MPDGMDEPAPLAYRIAFAVVAVGVIAWTFRQVGSVESLRAEAAKRFGFTPSRRQAAAWLALSVVVSLGMMAFLALYLLGRTG